MAPDSQVEIQGSVRTRCETYVCHSRRREKSGRVISDAGKRGASSTKRFLDVKLGGGALKNRKACMDVNMHKRMEIGNLDATTVNDDELYGYGALEIGLASVIVSQRSEYMHNVRIGHCVVNSSSSGAGIVLGVVTSKVLADRSAL